ncbi:uncharacterized protein LOC130725549 [Lotus japonicus]|uniref:uncharacterized protein LOC130725549 n=1 Tax=Lotus japonicus TaxID=34305 RepID=UPI00258F88F3|nr:uncharacterized protein LOC130725549 [Lotus japonicus]
MSNFGSSQIGSKNQKTRESLRILQHTRKTLQSKVRVEMQKKTLLPFNNGDPTKKKVSLCGKEALVKLLRWHFGYPDFRGQQLEAIQAVLSGRDCFCLMPTGGGKSMCYQIPALAKAGIVLDRKQLRFLTFVPFDSLNGGHLFTFIDFVVFFQTCCHVSAHVFFFIVYVRKIK